MKRATVLLAGVLLLSCLGICLAQNDAGFPPAADSHPGMGMMDGRMPEMPGMALVRMWPMCVQRLGLTEDQQRHLLGVFLDFAKHHVQVSGKIKADVISIAQIMLSDNPDKGKVEAIVREINKLQGDEMLACVNALFAAKDILTPEQWHSLQAMVPAMLAGMPPRGMGGRMGAVPGPRMGPGVPPPAPGTPQTPGQ